jgi:hypothetical protein
MQFYGYFVSQSSEFCRHNPLCYFSTSVYCCFISLPTQSGNFWIHPRVVCQVTYCMQYHVCNSVGIRNNLSRNYYISILLHLKWKQKMETHPSSSFISDTTERIRMKIGNMYLLSVETMFVVYLSSIIRTSHETQFVFIDLTKRDSLFKNWWHEIIGIHLIKTYNYNWKFLWCS